MKHPNTRGVPNVNRQKFRAYRLRLENYEHLFINFRHRNWPNNEIHAEVLFPKWLFLCFQRKRGVLSTLVVSCCSIDLLEGHYSSYAWLAADKLRFSKCHRKQLHASHSETQSTNFVSSGASKTLEPWTLERVRTATNLRDPSLGTISKLLQLNGAYLTPDACKGAAPRMELFDLHIWLIYCNKPQTTAKFLRHDKY